VMRVKASRYSDIGEDASHYIEGIERGRVRRCTEFMPIHQPKPSDARPTKRFGLRRSADKLRNLHVKAIEISDKGDKARG